MMITKTYRRRRRYDQDHGGTWVHNGSCRDIKVEHPGNYYYIPLKPGDTLEMDSHMTPRTIYITASTVGIRKNDWGMSYEVTE